MECFRIDESGYTGFDLLNADQRFQGAAAIAISNDDALRLINEHFPSHQGTELKYRTLSRRPGNRERLIALQRDVLRHYKCATYVCHKRFLLALMFVDYVIEPYYYAHGKDFYKDGANYSLASLLTLVGPTLLGRSAFAQLLAKFQFAVRAKTPSALAALVAAAQATRWRELPEALGPLALHASPDCLRAIATPGVTTDAAPIVLLTLINRMETMSDGPYRAEHDQSKNLLAYHQLFQRYIDHKEAKEFQISELATMKFPLKLSSVTQVDSKTSPAVQLADILIGAVIEASYNLFKIRSTGLDPESVLSLYADDQFFHLAPNLDFEDQKQFHHGTQAAEMIDYIAKNFAGADLP